MGLIIHCSASLLIVLMIIISGKQLSIYNFRLPDVLNIFQVQGVCVIK